MTAVDADIQAFLVKPYTAKELIKVVNQVLNQPNPQVLTAL